MTIPAKGKTYYRYRVEGKAENFYIRVYAQSEAKDKMVLYASSEHLYPGAENCQWTAPGPFLKCDSDDFCPFPFPETGGSESSSLSLMLDGEYWKFDSCWLYLTILNVSESPISAVLSVRGSSFSNFMYSRPIHK